MKPDLADQMLNGIILATMIIVALAMAVLIGLALS